MEKINNFERNDIFQRYNGMDDPFIIITVPVNVTNLVKYCKEHHYFYCLFGYYVAQTVKEIPEYRYRYVNGEYYICDKVGIGFTERVNNSIVYFDCDSEDRDEFVKEYIEKQRIVKTECKSISEERNDVVWVSTLPWIKFEGLNPPHSKSITIPQFIWGKYYEDNGEYYCNLMILIHHGFADGYHIYDFVNKFENNLKNI